jgi:choline dehydrogenase-like flavoprotein
MSDEPVDVLIVGAGASGAALAWSLAETRMNVLCLEQGDWMDPAAYPSTRNDWEMSRFGDFGLSPNTRGRSEDYPVNDSDSPISVSNFNAVGGSTILYAAHFPRFHPSDFRVRSLDGVADDWPLDYETLAPWYDENARMMGVAGLAGDPAYPEKDVPLPPVPLGTLGETLARGFNRLGWHWWPSDSAIATREYEGRAACINLGPCIMGCAQGAKASTDVTYWPVAVRRGVTLRTRCRVREITVDDDGMATGVVYYDADGVEHRQRAEIVVLACNGVGTPRLLLNSRSRLFPDGLANRSGLVGRNLMFHPYAMVTGIFEEPLEGYKGPTRRIRPAASCAATRSRSCGGWVRSPPRCGACRRGGCRGARNTTAPIRTSSTARRAWSSSARTCRRRATASPSIPISPTATASRRRRSPTASPRTAPE